MLATAVIVFREVLEAGLIVGIVLAASKGVPGRSLWVGLGVAAGVIGATLVAAFADALSALAEGVGQELFNAVILFAAVAMLGWHAVWMNRHARDMAAQMRAVGNAVASGNRPLYALAIVVAVAVLREGSEVVLFLYGIAMAGSDRLLAMLAGGVIGLAAGSAVGAALYFGLLRIPARRLFSVTGALVLLLAAGMAAQGADFLVQAGILPALGGQLWDSSALLPDHSLTGRVLHTLIGYVDRPSGTQILFYAATLGGLAGLARLLAPPPRRRDVAPAE